METEFLEWLNQNVQIADTTTNAYGEEVPGTPVAYAARVEYNHTMTRNDLGQEVVSKAQTYLSGNVPVTTKSQITLPDGNKPLILSVEANPDETGTIHHKVVYT